MIDILLGIISILIIIFMVFCVIKVLIIDNFKNKKKGKQVQSQNTVNNENKIKEYEKTITMQNSKIIELNRIVDYHLGKTKKNEDLENKISRQTNEINNYLAGITRQKDHIIQQDYTINSLKNDLSLLESKLEKQNQVNNSLLEKIKKDKDVIDVTENKPYIIEPTKPEILIHQEQKGASVSFKISGLQFDIEPEKDDNIETSEAIGSIYPEWYDPEQFRFGNRYKDKLNLTESELELLNRLWDRATVFSGIEFCMIEIIKLFLKSINELEKKYLQDGTTINKQLLQIAEIGKKYKNRSIDFEWIIDRIYLNIFIWCEDLVRSIYGYQRKLSKTYNNIYYTSNKLESEEIETTTGAKVFSKLNELKPILVKTISQPDKNTCDKLHSIPTYKASWKSYIEELMTNHKHSSKDFYNAIITLGELNKNNQSISNIFFQATNEFYRIDKITALSLYLHCIHYDTISNSSPKYISKTVQKSLFQTKEQLQDFENIISELIKNKDLEKALQDVPKIYEVKRKRIQIDKNKYQQITESHKETVKKLNQILQDDDVVVSLADIQQLEWHPQGLPLQNTIQSKIIFTEIQIETLELFATNNLTVSQKLLENFSKSKGAFKNQLIESINDVCYEYLDDVLIEEEAENHIINIDYYEKIKEYVRKY